MVACVEPPLEPKHRMGVIFVSHQQLIILIGVNFRLAIDRVCEGSSYVAILKQKRELLEKQRDDTIFSTPQRSLVIAGDSTKAFRLTPFTTH